MTNERQGKVKEKREGESQGGERETARKRGRETDKQTDRKADRKTDFCTVGIQGRFRLHFPAGNTHFHKARNSALITVSYYLLFFDVSFFTSFLSMQQRWVNMIFFFPG